MENILIDTNVYDLKNQDISTILKMELDEGESEAIALADELKADIVLLDEKDARRIAKQLGLRVLGTIGILVWGKRVLENLIKSSGRILGTGDK